MGSCMQDPEWTRQNLPERGPGARLAELPGPVQSGAWAWRIAFALNFSAGVPLPACIRWGPRSPAGILIDMASPRLHARSSHPSHRTEVEVGMAMAVSKAKELGIRHLAVPTAGNAGGAMAAMRRGPAVSAHVFTTVRLNRVSRHTPDVEVWARLQFANPGGSVKDRPALRMIQDALADKRMTRDKILIDSTSGNTGVAYSLFGAALGLRIRLVMPSNVSKARKDIARSFGTEIVYSDPMEGSDGAIRLARELVAKEPDTYFYPDQYSNPSNWRAHYDGTGREILEAWDRG